MKTSNHRRAGKLPHLAIAALGLFAAGCSDDGYGYSSTPDNNSPSSYSPSVAIVSPARNGAVSGTSLQVKVSTGYFTITAPGGALKDGEGHIHVYIDKPASSPAYDAVIKQASAEPTATLPTPTTPGAHYIIVALQKNDHSPYGIQDSVAFTVPAEPSNPTTTVPGNTYGTGDYGSY
jgi:hypothetical protein